MSKKTIILSVGILSIMATYFLVQQVFGVTLGGNINMNGYRITNLGAPSLDSDAVTLSTVKSIAAENVICNGCVDSTDINTNTRLSGTHAYQKSGTIANGLVYCSEIYFYTSYFRCENPKVRYWYNGAERNRNIAAFTESLRNICFALHGHYYTHSSASRTQQYYAFFQTYGDDYYRWQDYSNPNYYVTRIYCYYE